MFCSVISCVKLKMTQYFTVFYVSFLKFLPYSVYFLNSKYLKFSGKLTLTRLLKPTKIIWTARVKKNRSTIISCSETCLYCRMDVSAVEPELSGLNTLSFLTLSSLLH
jgi:hypothetical protein